MASAPDSGLAQAAPAAPVMAGRDWALLGLMSAMFGGAFTFIELGLRAADPVTLMALRVGLGGLALSVALAATGQGLPRGRWRDLFIIGTLNTALPFSLIMWAQTHLTSGLTAILNTSAPVFAVLLAHVFFADEKLRAHRLAGVLMGMAGVAVVLGPGALDGAENHLGAELAVLAAALSYALAGVYGRRHGLGGLAPVQAAGGMLLAASVCAVPLAFLLGEPVKSLAALSTDAVALGGVAGVALVSSAAAYPLYFILLRRVGVGNLLLVAILGPTVGVFLGVVALGETLAWTAFAGLALIVIGLLTMDGRFPRLRT
ncbi:MAG: DMT family transporter [Alphaproteobacteria bacterium]